ncbi:MAG: hypothetical protein IPL53_24875 [Ignavibacteria bacterium]|nr:hypothetical protein [Ignavibacteria bacterium]
MEIDIVTNWFELLSYIATVIGIPFAIYVFYKDKVKERKLQEKEALFTSHSLYTDYLKICLENPELDVYNSSFNKKEYSLNEKKSLSYLKYYLHTWKLHFSIIKTSRMRLKITDGMAGLIT